MSVASVPAAGFKVPLVTGARNAGIDLLRIVGVIAVVMGHVFVGQWVQRGIYSWHVPLFFFLSGYFWSGGRCLREEAKRRANSLLRPYLFWLAAIGVPFLALQPPGELEAKEALPLVLGGAFLTRPFSAFWFVTALFASCLAYRLLERMSVAVKLPVVVAPLLACYLGPGYVAHVPWAVGTAMAALVFIYAGQCFRVYGPRFPSVWVGWSALGMGAILAGSGVVGPLDMKQALYGTPVASVVVAILICAGATRLADRYGERLTPGASLWIGRIAQSALMVVLSHSAVLQLLGTGPNDWWPGSPLAVLVPWAVGMLVLWTPVAPWVLGVSRMRRRQGRHVFEEKA